MMPKSMSFRVFWQQIASLILCTGATFAIDSSQENQVYWGTPLGRFPDIQGVGISGNVFVVNKSCIQVLNFTYMKTGQDIYFFIDIEEEISSSGTKLPTFDYGNHAINDYDNSRAVLMLPLGQTVTDFRSFGLYDPISKKIYSSISIPIDVHIPRGQFLNGTFHGIRYHAKSAGVWALDRRTFIVQKFTFQGVKSPATYFLAGRGPFIKEEAGIKMNIRTPQADLHKSRLVKNYRNENLIIQIPETYPYDVYSIDWISLFCTEFRIDLASIFVKRLRADIPPYVPQPVLHPLINIKTEEEPLEPWKRAKLFGWPKTRTNFTFQLGPAGGKRGYSSWNGGQIANDYVWYVNGYMAPILVLERDVQYRFIVQGGDNNDVPLYTYNPLYIGTDNHGGYATLRNDENKKAYPVYAGLDFRGRILKGHQKSVGFLCMWTPESSGINPDLYNSFEEYQKVLNLGCVKYGNAGSFTWTPYDETPSKLHYQSYTNFNMGGEIRIVDKISSENAAEDSPDLEYEVGSTLDAHALSSQVPIPDPVKCHVKCKMSSKVPWKMANVRLPCRRAFYTSFDTLRDILHFTGHLQCLGLPQASRHCATSSMINLCKLAMIVIMFLLVRCV